MGKPIAVTQNASSEAGEKGRLHEISKPDCLKFDDWQKSKLSSWGRSLKKTRHWLNIFLPAFSRFYI